MKIQRRWMFILGLLLLGMLVVGGMIWTRRRLTATPDQPIAFSHQRHDTAGVPCLYCHPNALRSDAAGIPTVEKCVGCHRTVATDRPRIQQVLSYWEAGEVIPWTRVEDQPDFVFFSHQPHLRSGLNCESCHGMVQEMDTVHSVVDMDMGWCLECHQDQPQEKVARLEDCIACHK